MGSDAGRDGDGVTGAGTVERVSRWLASRSTRRSFLGRLGRGAVLVASGSTVAGLISERPAEARVCGQSGVAQLCPTFDCYDTWGWCWYATGCCANGGLKKICDCCAPIDFVHGYCPSGTNVKCIVESCGNDPRVQTVPTTRLEHGDPVALSAAASRARHAPSTRDTVVLVDPDPLWAATAAPYAAHLGAALLLARRDALASSTVAELQRLGAATVRLFGRGWSPPVHDTLRRYGVGIEAVVALDDVVAAGDDVARLLGRAGENRVVCVEPTGISGSVAPLAGALAAAMGHPLVIGVDAARRQRAVITYLVGPEASARAGEIPGGHPMFDTALDRLSVAIAEAGARAGADISSVGLLPGHDPALAAGLLSFGAPILLHGPDQLGVARDWMFSRRDRFRRVAVAGTAGALGTGGYYEVQSLVNGFEAHLLIGVAGQGLPVITQPDAERPLGLARIASAPPPDDQSSGYWTGRAFVPSGD